MFNLLTAFGSATIAHVISFDSGFYLWQVENDMILRDYIESWATALLARR